jgi:hypothetical protein
MSKAWEFRALSSLKFFSAAFNLPPEREGEGEEGGGEG